MELALPETPGEWLRTTLPALMTFDEGEEAELDAASQARSYADLLADDGAVLKACHAALMADDVTPQAAATYLAGYFPAAPGRVLGIALAAARAGLVITPEAFTWHVHPEGWAERTDVGDVLVLVTPGHPWAGQPGTETVDEDTMIARSVESLLDFGRPLVDACKPLAKVKKSSLWDEVADSIATSMGYRPRPLAPAAMDLLTKAVSLPDMPWKAEPRVGNVVSEVLGPVHVAQKGGCCLAFTCKDEEAEDPDKELDEEERAFKERFPGPDKGYCTTCKFRDPQDSDARQVFWIEQQHAS